MTVSQTAAAAPAPPGRLHLRRLLIWAILIVVIAAAADLLGWDIRGWFSNLWDTITEISAAYLVAGVALKTVQTTLTAFAWYAILRYAYPTTNFRVVLACYATSVALNGFLPREHRDLRDAADVHDDHRGGDLLRRPRRLRGGEDLLHGDRRLHLPVPLPLGQRLVRRQVRLRAQPPVGDRDPRARRYLPDLPADPRLLAQDLQLVGRRERGRRHPGRAAQVLHPCVHPVAARLDRQPRRDGGVPLGLRHSRQLRHADAALRRQLDRQRHLGHARRRRRQPGLQRRLAERGHRPDDRNRLLGRPAARHDR